MTEQQDPNYYKPIRFRFPYWQEVKSFAEELEAERGSKQDLPKVVLEAIKFMRDNRKMVVEADKFIRDNREKTGV